MKRKTWTRGCVLWQALPPWKNLHTTITEEYMTAFIKVRSFSGEQKFKVGIIHYYILWPAYDCKGNYFPYNGHYPLIRNGKNPKGIYK